MARCLCCVNAFRCSFRSFVLPQLRGTHSAVEPVICVSLQQRRLAVSKFQDTRTVTSLGCIETKSSRRAAVRASPLLQDHTNDITHYTPFSLSLYIYPHTHTHTHTHTHNRSLHLLHRSLLPSSIHNKLKTMANHSLSANRAQNREAQTSVRSINSFGGRITLANSLLMILDPSKMAAVRKGMINLWNTDILFDRLALPV